MKANKGQAVTGKNLRLFGKDRLWWEIVLVALLFLAGLYFRLRCAKYVTYELAGDALNYHNMALRLLKGGAFGYNSEQANAYVMPLYPLFLSFLYKVFGTANGIFTVKVVQSVLGALTAVTGYMIGRRFFNRVIALIIGICLAFYPPFIMGGANLLTECLYVFLFMIYFYVQLLSLNDTTSSSRKKYVLAAISGGLFALCMLVRAGAVILLMVPYLYKYIANRKDKAVQKTVKFEFLFFLGAFLLCMLPWWIRNYAVLGQVVLFCTQTGNPLLYGTFPDMAIPYDYHVAPADEIKVALKRIWEGFTTSPLIYLKWYTLGKFRLIFLNIWYYFPSPVGVPYHLAYLYIMHYTLVIGGWIGTFWGMFRKTLRFISIEILILTFLQLLVIPTERYAYTILPLLIIAMASYLYESFSLLRTKNQFQQKHNHNRRDFFYTRISFSLFSGENEET